MTWNNDHDIPQLPVSKQRQIVQNFPGNVSKKSGHCWISEKRNIQPKIPEFSEGKSNETEIPLQGCPRTLFRKFCKMLFQSTLEMSGNLNGTFSWNPRERDVRNSTVRNLRRCNLQPIKINFYVIKIEFCQEGQRPGKHMSILCLFSYLMVHSNDVLFLLIKVGKVSPSTMLLI